MGGLQVDVKPVIGTVACQASHLGLILSGKVCCLHDDGNEVTKTCGHETVPLIFERIIISE